MHKDTESTLGYSRTTQESGKKSKLDRDSQWEPYDEDLAGIPDRGSLMYSPRVFLGISIVLLGFAIYNYVSTGLLTSTIIRTVVAAVILQTGYFFLVVWLVMRRVRSRISDIRESQAAHDREMQKEKDKYRACPLTHVNKADKH
ncbi:exopolysaccharide production repressor protein [Agrobacterium vitis]|uniref:exopolysaccharide production repressor protein n=1 Tax=Agrobacterium vitis TaxID=373 RepID=UPI0012E8F56E|nr:exopolysaccharide production repressor protein [Agrobacterium vitis]MVA24393.1 hypothetical protein [Agrobacterium vitis]